MNLYQHAKNQAFSSFCSRDTVDLKILQFDWTRVFWPIFQEPEFFQVWDLHKNTVNYIKIYSKLCKDLQLIYLATDILSLGFLGFLEFLRS